MPCPLASCRLVKLKPVEAELPLMAISSSPSPMKEFLTVMFVTPLGSMPSVLRAVHGVAILASQKVKPLLEEFLTWKWGELRKVIL